LLELFAEDAADIRAALSGGQARLSIQTTDENGPAHFEVRVIFDRRHGGGAYFLVHDVTETRQLQIALLNCADREQMRIGQDLHDTLGQELTGAAYRLHALREAAPPELADGLDALQERISHCLKRSRDIAFTLSPHIGSEEIVGAFERLCVHVRETFGIECIFTSQLARPISDPGVAFNLFRIAQEACTNAVRHASPGRIEIHLVTGGENRLEIADDGVGIDDADISDFPGMGIPGMKFRAEAMGGSLRLSRRESSGTIVRCRFENKHTPETDPPSLDTPCETCS
jgi:two-component system CheB/CheR fusion protein